MGPLCNVAPAGEGGIRTPETFWAYTFPGVRHKPCSATSPQEANSMPSRLSQYAETLNSAHGNSAGGGVPLTGTPGRCAIGGACEQLRVSVAIDECPVGPIRHEFRRGRIGCDWEAVQISGASSPASKHETSRLWMRTSGT
jgi:hypothetical protein